jgi:diguanylate cyclase (GGDEF)-like protein
MAAISLPLAILVATGVLSVLVLALALVFRDRTRRSLREHARIDLATRLPNRAAWAEELAREVARSRRHRLRFSVALLDLTDLRALNLRKGHEEGTEALVRCARAWREALREEDVLVRLDGKRFAVLLPQCDAPEALTLAEGLRAATTDGLTLAVGLVAWDGSEGAGALETRADQALQRDKRRLAIAGSSAYGHAASRTGDEPADDRSAELVGSAWR